MKETFLALLLFTGIFVYGQDTKLLDILPLKDGKVTYVGVVQVEGADKNQLYTRAKKWFVDTYKSANDVIQLDDKENGEVIGKGFFKTMWQVTFMSSQEVNVWHTIKLSFKDNKFRYEITGFRLRYYVSPSTYTRAQDVDVALEEFGRDREKNAKKFYTQVDTEIKATMASIEKYMKSKPQDDW